MLSESAKLLARNNPELLEFMEALDSQRKRPDKLPRHYLERGYCADGTTSFESGTVELEGKVYQYTYYDDDPSTMLFDIGGRRVRMSSIKNPEEVYPPIPREPSELDCALSWLPIPYFGERAAKRIHDHRKWVGTDSDDVVACPTDLVADVVLPRIASYVATGVSLAALVHYFS